MHVRRFLLAAVLCFGLLSCSTPHGRRTTPFPPSWILQNATATDLSAALNEADQILSQGLNTSDQRQAYASATHRVLSLWLRLSKDRTTPMKVSESYQLTPQAPANLRFDDLIPADTIKSKRLKHRMTREGVGLPLVAHWKHSPERKAAEPFLSEGGYLSPVTATLDFTARRGGQRTALLQIHDSRIVQEVDLGGKNYRLAADLTAYGEYLLSMEQVQMHGIKALLRSSQHMDKLGLIALEHPDKNRIPLVLVHGLMSRPATWENAINEFGTNPDIQRYYQVYLFRYPSGVPIIFSSEKLREHLALLHQTLRAEGAGKTCRNMVLIGHSMGGLVSKAQIQDSGNHLWMNILGNTPDALGLTAKEYQALRRYLEFDPNPNISRVIFAATPHRGSQMADSRLAQIGRRLVQLPGQTFGTTFEILEGIAARDAFLSKLLAKGMPTSMDNLSPNSPYVKIANSLTFRPGVHLHSIIGNKSGRELTDPKCSDGVVPYTSAHIEGAESELIVRSDHGVHEKPEAIQEMRRILRLHLQQLHLH